MKLQMRLLVYGCALLALATAASAANTVSVKKAASEANLSDGFAMFPVPQPSMTLVGTSGSAAIGAEGNAAWNSDSEKLPKSEASLLSQIDLTAIPEPPVYMLLGLGLLVCAQRMIKRRRAAR